MGPASADWLHLFSEAKLAFEDRAKFYADGDVVDTPVDVLISKAYEKRGKYRYATGESKCRPRNPRIQNGDTVYLTVVDKNVTAVP